MTPEVLLLELENAALRRAMAGLVSAPSSPRPEGSFRISAAEMRALLLAKPGRIEAALLKLDSFQTADERDDGETKHRNGRGFSKKHYTAETKKMLAWIRSHANRNLSGRKLPFSLLTNGGGYPWAIKAKVLVMSYARQLAEIAEQEGNLDWLRF